MLIISASEEWGSWEPPKHILQREEKEESTQAEQRKESESSTKVLLHIFFLSTRLLFSLCLLPLYHPVPFFSVYIIQREQLHRWRIRRCFFRRKNIHVFVFAFLLRIANAFAWFELIKGRFDIKTLKKHIKLVIHMIVDTCVCAYACKYIQDVFFPGWIEFFLSCWFCFVLVYLSSFPCWSSARRRHALTLCFSCSH